MNVIALSWETWRAVVAVLRGKALPYMLEHADHLEQQLERHGPDVPTVRLSLTDDVYLRSFNWARVQLGIPLPADCGCGAATGVSEAEQVPGPVFGRSDLTLAPWGPAPGS